MCKPYFIVAPDRDAYKNLARDELFLERLAPGEILLYLYVNSNAVIIGRNQNPYTECDLDRMEKDGVQLVRRITGGGAVYHDEGNLNYSFIASEKVYDEKRQTQVILSALRSFGIDAEVTGRNDLCVQGLKFSGNAFGKKGNTRQHHGTLLIDSRLELFGHYLTPSKLKLESKGIKSVRSRVCRLCDINPCISIPSMKLALKREFDTQYGESQSYPLSEKDPRLNELVQKHSSKAWRMGESPAFDVAIEGRVDFGNFKLCLQVRNGKIVLCRLYTDSLETGLSDEVQNLLTGISFDKCAIIRALMTDKYKYRQLIECIEEQSI